MLVLRFLQSPKRYPAIELFEFEQLQLVTWMTTGKTSLPLRKLLTFTPNSVLYNRA